MTFWFAWVDAADAVFDAAYKREDEKIVGLRLSEDEGIAATLDIEVEIPASGLLSAGRKQWAWLSHDDGATVTPLFFGRLTTVGGEESERSITLRLQARPANYEAAKEAAAATMRSGIWFDPVWMTPEARDDPDSVHLARPNHWHVDRVTHAITSVPIDNGPDGTVDLAGDFVHASLLVELGDAPLRKISCDLSVWWTQAAAGEIDITDDLVAAFNATSPKTEYHGLISSYTGAGLMEDWPGDGDKIGGVWSYGACDITRYDGWRLPADYTQVVLSNLDIADFPIWKMKPVLAVRYDIARPRAETLTFTLEADTQSVFIDSGDAAEETLSLSSRDVEQPIDAGGAIPIGDVRRRSYFKTDRGRRSIENAIAMCRSELIERARCIDISAEIAIGDYLGLSLRKNARLADDRIQGGEATGKIKSLWLEVNGDAATINAGLTIGCMVGTGNTVSASAGTGQWADSAYTGADYQVFDSRVVMPISGEVTYDDYLSTPIVDDGLDLLDFAAADAIVDLYVINGPLAQYRVIQGYAADDSSVTWLSGDETASPHRDYLQQVIDALDEIYTQVDLTLLPVAKGPDEDTDGNPGGIWTTAFALTVSQLKVAKTIDFEAAAW